MARIVKEEEYAVRRNEILDVVQRLVYTKGYEQMTIQEILDELKISKGAFYHYFESKQALLEALIERIIQEALKVLVPIVEDPTLPALEKFQRFFDTATRWKTARKTFLLAMLRGWYTDDNAIVRQKVTSGGIEQMSPLLTTLVQQGVREGVFKTSHLDQVGGVVMSLIMNMGEIMGPLLLSDEPEDSVLRRVEGTITAYTDAIERVMGAPAGSLTLVDMETMKEWLVAPAKKRKP